MDNLEKLRQANPHIPIRSVHDDAFRRYGRVVPEDTAAFCAAAETIPFPEEGSRYAASLPELEELPEAKRLRQVHCGGLDEQIGLCWGHSSRLNALEWHTCNEWNIAVRELVLLLAKREDLDADGRLDARKVQAFYLARGEMIEVYSDTLHFCPCEVTGEGFSCIVGLQRGTNLPIAPEQRENCLWAANKWLLGHEKNTDLIRRGAFPGIYGENWEIHPV